MTNKPFYILEVFAREKYAGNQLAVFREGSRYTDAEMQKIAREINFSETTFIMADKEEDGGFPVRIFTPEEELPFAGHPTLGTAYIIRHEILGKPVEKVILSLKAGKIPVTFTLGEDSKEMLWMKQNPPEFGRTIDTKTIAPVLGLTVEDIDDRFPVQEVSTALFCTIVPLKTLDAVKRSQVHRERYRELLKEYHAKSILVFSRETCSPEHHVHVRVYADYFGVPEDPATGSANGCLAAYLAKHRFFGTSTLDVKAEQGYEMGRPSLLYLQAEENDGIIDVHVGGRVIPVARGQWG